MVLDLLKRSELGAEIPWVDEDQNKTDIEDAVNALAIPGDGIIPYDPVFTYLAGTLYIRSYAGSIYTFISPTDQTGITPGTDPTVWELTNIQNLFHQQGTDQYLDYGGANQVSVVALYEFLNNQVVVVGSLASFAALFVAGTLKKNRVYYCTIGKLFLKTNDNAFPCLTGYKILRVPKYESLSKWEPNPVSFSSGQKVVREGLVYNHITGVNTTTAPTGDATNWALVSNVDATYYKDWTVEVLFTNDFSDITEVRDGAGNEMPYSNLNYFPFGDPVLSDCKFSGSYGFVLNSFGGVSIKLLNSLLDTGSAFIEATGLVVENSTLNIQCEVGTSFSNVVVKNSIMTFPMLSGWLIQDSSFETDAQTNASGGITFPNNRDFISETLTPTSSTIQETLDVTGATSIDLDATYPALYLRAIGKIILNTSNAAESIQYITAFQGFKGRIYAAPGKLIDIITTSVGAIGTDGEMISDLPGSTYTLDGDHGDYMEILETKTIATKAINVVKFYITQ